MQGRHYKGIFLEDQHLQLTRRAAGQILTLLSNMDLVDIPERLAFQIREVRLDVLKDIFLCLNNWPQVLICKFIFYSIVFPFSL